ncbi:MAG: homoserine kinase [Candidatus Gastranaerophilales bacterium]|nr:homoserine kinase [Candidatus Gastranaerophilales bacterium]
MKVTVKVPATTANIGPGFDCFGLALPIYNTITLEETVYPTTGLEINVLAGDSQEIADFRVPTDETNIIYKAIELLYTYIGQTPPALRINIKSDIPIAKGLGSSASVIVGGILAANELLGKPADMDALLAIANEVEGHPDNIAPALLGGFVLSSVEDDGSIEWRKIQWPENWHLTVCIPDYELSTEISRSVLPQEVPLLDAAFNARRCAMFVEALHSQDVKLMKLALKDKLHQPHRMRLVPGLEEISNKLENVENVMGTVLSGAGPAILVISYGNNLSEIKNIITETWETLSVKSKVKTFDIEEQGAQILKVQ